MPAVVSPESRAASVTPTSSGVAGVSGVADGAGTVLLRVSPISMVSGASSLTIGELAAWASSGARGGGAVVVGLVRSGRGPSASLGANLSCSMCSLAGPIPGQSTVKT